MLTDYSRHLLMTGNAGSLLPNREINKMPVS